MPTQLHRLSSGSLLSCLLLLFLLMSGTTSQAQISPQDSLQVQKLLEQGREEFAQDSLSAASHYYLQAEALSRKTDYHRGVSISLRGQVKVLERQGKYKEGLESALEAIEISKKIDQKDLALSYNFAGNLYHSLGNLEEAATAYLTAFEIAQHLGDASSQRMYGTNLATVFGEIGDFEKCFQYASDSYQLAKQKQDSLGMAKCLTTMANSQLSLGNYDNAYHYSLEQLQLAKKLQNIDLQVTAFYILGDAETERKNYQNALSYFQQGLQVLHYRPSPMWEFYISWGMSTAYLKMGMPEQAEYYFNKSSDMPQVANSPLILKGIYQLGTEIYEELKNSPRALEYHKKYVALNDSLMGAETQQNIHRMEIEYQTAQKEKEITEKSLMLAQNRLEIEKKNNLIYLSLVAVIVLLSGIIIFYMRYRDKQKANAQRLHTLRQESELKVLMARIEGEEKERNRLAKELHDGVGGILSATKMHLSVLQNELDWAGQGQKFDHTTSMLDTASREVRTIAHNLSSDILIRYELDQALANFCNSVSNPSLQVDFYYLGETIRLRSNFKQVLYRMVQELVNNIIKHATASQALVQLSLHDHLLSLTVEDNGKGFEWSESKGIGLANLKARVKDMQGEMSIESSPGNGTTVYAEFDIRPFLEKDTIEAKAP